MTQSSPTPGSHHFGLPFQLLWSTGGLCAGYKRDPKARNPEFNKEGQGHKAKVFRGQNVGLASVSKRWLRVAGSGVS